jgi:hypothetical protein
VEDFSRDVIIPNFEGQLSELRALPPPEADEDAVNEIYDELESAIEEAKDDPASLATSDPFVDATALAHDYGLSNCGTG